MINKEMRVNPEENRPHCHETELCNNIQCHLKLDMPSSGEETPDSYKNNISSLYYADKDLAAPVGTSGWNFKVFSVTCKLIKSLVCLCVAWKSFCSCDVSYSRVLKFSKVAPK